MKFSMESLNEIPYEIPRGVLDRIPKLILQEISRYKELIEKFQLFSKWIPEKNMLKNFPTNL